MCRLTRVQLERRNRCSLDKTIVYLLRPQMTSLFDVNIVITDSRNGLIEGSELKKLAKFLRISEGVPQFDLEYGGRLFRKCRLSAPEPDAALAFSFELSTVPEPTKSDPNASYR